MFSRLLIITTTHHIIHPSINQSMWNDGLHNFMDFLEFQEKQDIKKTTRTQTVELEYFWKWRQIRCETSVHYYAFWACHQCLRCLHHLVERFINILLKLCQKKRKEKRKMRRFCRHREYTIRNVHVYEDERESNKVWQYGKPSNGTWHKWSFLLVENIQACIYWIHLKFTQSTRRICSTEGNGKQSVLYKTVCVQHPSVRSLRNVRPP